MRVYLPSNEYTEATLIERVIRDHYTNKFYDYFTRKYGVLFENIYRISGPSGVIHVADAYNYIIKSLIIQEDKICIVDSKYVIPTRRRPNISGNCTMLDLSTNMKKCTIEYGHNGKKTVGFAYEFDIVHDLINPLTIPKDKSILIIQIKENDLLHKGVCIDDSTRTDKIIVKSDGTFKITSMQVEDFASFDEAMDLWYERVY